jgi:hypothetical protein
MIKEFEKINSGTPKMAQAIPQLLDKLKNEISGFFAAKDAIWRPRTESGSKTKSTLSMVSGRAFFSPRPETFISAIEESFVQTTRLFEQSGFSSREVEIFGNVLLKHKDKISRNFSSLDAAMAKLPQCASRFETNL